MADRSKPRAYSASVAPLAVLRTTSSPAWVWSVLLLVALGGVGANPVWAQEKPTDKLSFLVARTPVLDPFFKRSVVLLLPIEGEPVVVGLVVNKPTRVKLLDLFPKSPVLKSRSEIAYLGGPVDMGAAALAFHSPKAPKQAMLLYDDVYLTFDLKFITKLLQDPKQTGEFRLFLGRAQWAPDQLQGEALEGSWYNLRTEGAVIFDRDTEHLWQRLHDLAQPGVSVENRSSPYGQNHSVRKVSWPEK